MKFLSPEVALYLYKSTIRPCMEYCCHIWAGAPSCYLELLDKLQKQICRTVGPSLAASLEPLAHHCYQKQKGPETSDHSLFRLQSKLRKIPLLVMHYLAKFDDVI